MIIQGFGGKGGGARKPVIEPEGIFVQIDGSEEYQRAYSKNRIELLDLLCEGEVQGLVSGYNRYHGGYIGRTGWSDVEFIPFNDGILSGTSINSGVLRSVYYNNTPVLDESNKYNFSNIQFKFVPGTANGATGIGTQSIFDEEITITTPISENLLGPNFSYSDNGRPIPALGTDRKDKYRGNYDALLQLDPDAALQNRKVYRFYDRNIVAFNVNLRLTSLNYQEVENIKKYGDSLSYHFDAIIKVRQVFKNQDTLNLFSIDKERNVNLVGRVSSSPFLYTERINLEDQSTNNNFLAWEVEIIRKTAEAVHPAVSCSANVDSITQIFSQTYRYPHSVLASNLFDAEFFSQVPDTSYLLDLTKIKVPSNYDPIKKSYDSFWDGTFKDNKEWSNNPAWVYYDMITNKRYGLGNFIDEDFVDKWSLYEIGQYCDQLVRDGYSAAESPSSGLEPRFEANILLNTQEEAYDVANSLASVFRGMTYYLAGNIDVSQDSPKEPKVIFTNANVKDGNFVYASSSQRSRHTVALVRYNDKLNNYIPTLEYIEDPDGIRKYGINQQDISAIGCTSRGQAYRLGKWLLTTERLETSTISFQAGLGEASLLRPGDVIKVFDENKTKKRYSGRTLKTEIYAYPNESGAKILVDRKIPIHNWETYKFSIATPTYNYEPSLINSASLDSRDISGINRGMIQEIFFTGGPTTISHNNGLTEITFTGDPYTGVGMSQFNTGDYDIANNLIFAIEKSGNAVDDCESELYKVITVKEEEPMLYSVFGTFHETGKYDIIETGLNFGSDVTQQQNIGAPVLKNVIFNDENGCNPSFIVTKGENNKYILFYEGVNLQENVYQPTQRPPNSHRVAIIPVNDDVDDVVIDRQLLGNRNYDFGFWGTDGSFISTNGAVFSSFNGGEPIETKDCPGSVCGISVNSLRGIGQNRTNPGASRQTVIVSEPEPQFFWNWSFDLRVFDEEALSNYKTRIQIYSPKDTDSLEGRELYSQDLLNFLPQGNYEFSMEDNIQFFQNKALEDGPYRDYDIVVSAYDAKEKRHSYECNRNGYDILGVTNPVPETVLISSFDPVVTVNSITLNFSNFDVEGVESRSDYRGFAIFCSPQEFTTEDIKNTNLFLGNVIKIFYRFLDDYPDMQDEIKIVVPGNRNTTIGTFRYSTLVLLDRFDQEVMDYLSSINGIRPEDYLRQKVGISSRIQAIENIN